MYIRACEYLNHNSKSERAGKADFFAKLKINGVYLKDTCYNKHSTTKGKYHEAQFSDKDG